MQNELNGEAPDAVAMVTVNEAGFEAGLQVMAEVADLPLLQDNEEEEVWASWEAQYHDIMILDRSNRCYTIFSVTTQKLREEENYNALKALFQAAIDGEESQKPCH